MEQLKAKLKKQGGFTLVEMLIVVAIIAILIAVSIPLIDSSLEKARDATDDANYRSAAALGEVLYITDSGSITSSTEYWYCISTNNKTGGVLKTGADATNLYTSKCTGSSHGETGTSKEQNIKVTIDPSQTDIEDIVKVEWAKKS